MRKCILNEGFIPYVAAAVIISVLIGALSNSETVSGGDSYIVERLAMSNTLCVQGMCRIKVLNVETNETTIHRTHSAIFKGEVVYQKCERLISENEEPVEACSNMITRHLPTGYKQTVNQINREKINEES